MMPNKKTFYIILASLIVLTDISCSTKREHKKVKTEKVFRYQYQSGEPNKIGELDQQIGYNEFGNRIQFINYSGGTISSTFAYTYEKDTCLTSVTHYDKAGTIIYKKIIQYNLHNNVDNFRIYSDHELIGGIKFYYNKDNQIAEKKYLGAIDYNENEDISFVSISGGLNRDYNLRSEYIKIMATKDSVSAKYYRNTHGDIEKIVIISKHDPKAQIAKNEYINGTNQVSLVTPPKDFMDTTIISFDNKYNSDKLLIYKCIKENGQTPSESKFFDRNELPHDPDGTYYIYGDKKLIQEKVMDNGYCKLLKLYDSTGNLNEVQSFHIESLTWKEKIKYNDAGLVTEMVHYNMIEEPEYSLRNVYEYY
jgi:hypothetical protein